MQQKMYRGLTAATLVLLALVVLAIASPAVRAAEDIVYTVVVDLNSTPPRALNAATGQPLSQSDVQVVNPEDQHTYELQAKDITGNAVDLWVVEQHIDGSNVVHWAATNITSTKTYHPWAQAKLRAWVQVDRDAACSTAEQLSGGNFVCGPDTINVVVDLNSTPPRALNAATGQPLSQSDVQVVNPEDQHTYELQAKDITGNAVDLWVVEQHIDGSNVVHWAATNITSTKTYHTWAQAKLRAWVQKNRDEACANAERLDQSFSCTAVEPPWVIFLPIVQR